MTLGGEGALTYVGLKGVRKRSLASCYATNGYVAMVS